MDLLLLCLCFRENWDWIRMYWRSASSRSKIFTPMRRSTTNLWRARSSQAILRLRLPARSLFSRRKGIDWLTTIIHYRLGKGMCCLINKDHITSFIPGWLAISCRFSFGRSITSPASSWSFQRLVLRHLRPFLSWVRELGCLSHQMRWIWGQWSKVH